MYTHTVLRLSNRRSLSSLLCSCCFCLHLTIFLTFFLRLFSLFSSSLTLYPLVFHHPLHILSNAFYLFVSILSYESLECCSWVCVFVCRKKTLYKVKNKTFSFQMDREKCKRRLKQQQQQQQKHEQRYAHIIHDLMKHDTMLFHRQKQQQ